MSSSTSIWLARVRLQKAQTIGLKHQAFFVADKTVQRIVHDRIADVGQMNADLVLASGGNVGTDERFVFKQFQTGECGYGQVCLWRRPSSFRLRDGCRAIGLLMSISR